MAHRHADAAVAERIARGLIARGIRAWFDGFEVVPGESFVAAMEEGIAPAHGGVIVLSAAGIAGSWTYEEYAALLRAAVEHRGEGPRPFVIPVRVGDDAVVPPFLATRHALGVDDLDALADAILRHTGHRPRSKAPPLGPLGGA